MTPVMWKPSIACLFCHPSAWSYEMSDVDGDVYHCFVCERYFYYPTKRFKLPIYHKYNKK